MQLKRQSVEAWQNEKHYSEGNNTSENPIPRQEIANQSTMEEVGRSGQVTIFVVCAVFCLSCQAVVLLTETAKNHRFFSVKELLLYNRIEAFFENFRRKWKMHHVELNSGTSKSSK